jgi:hypothetical protein
MNPAPPPHAYWYARLVPNAVFGALLLSALLANIARGRLELSEQFEEAFDEEGDT